MSNDVDLMMELSSERQARVEAEKRLMFLAMNTQAMLDSNIEYLVGLHNSLVGGKESFRYLIEEFVKSMAKMYSNYADAVGATALTFDQYGSQYEVTATNDEGEEATGPLGPVEFGNRMQELHDYMDKEDIGANGPEVLKQMAQITLTDDPHSINNALQSEDMPVTRKTLLLVGQILSLVLRKAHAEKNISDFIDKDKAVH